MKETIDLVELVSHRGDVTRAARRWVKDRLVAEEAAQDAYITLWSRPETWDPARGEALTFLRAIAARRAVDGARCEARRRRPAPYLDSVLGDDISAGVQVACDVRRALMNLPATQRAAVFLAYYAGFSRREVAEYLDIPEGTAKARVRRGLGKLREILTADAA